MQIGIVGLPNSTKTTIFNALTKSQEETAVTSSGQVEVHTAIVEVPDPRVDKLSAMFNPEKTTYARVQYNDVAGLKIGSGQDGSLSGQLLNAISQSDGPGDGPRPIRRCNNGRWYVEIQNLEVVAGKWLIH